MTHAWLIIAHNEFGILQRLVSALDDEDHDIYIHIDKKVKRIPEIKALKSKLFILDKRIDVRWGHVSQIKCEDLLWETAVQNGPYDSYILLSGTHLPLKPLDEIKAFFQSYAGKNLLPGFEKADGYQKTLKMNRYNLFLRNANYGPLWKKRFYQFLWKACVKIQRILNIQNHRHSVFYYSSNWVALTQEAVTFLLSVKHDILKKYKYTFCGDEWFVATELAHSSLISTIVSPPFYLYSEWTRANPKTYSLKEYEALCETGHVFARKFKAT